MTARTNHRLYRRRSHGDAHYHVLLKCTVLFLAAGLALSGCVDKITSLGAEYYTDTIANQTSIRYDSAFFRLADTLRPFVTANGIDYALNDSTTLMIIGRVAQNQESLESWGLMQFLPMTPDTDAMISGVNLILKDENFSYGDTTSSIVSYNVFAVSNAVYDSTYSFPAASSGVPANGNPVLVGTIDTLSFTDSTDRELVIPLDSAIIPRLTESSLGFVIVPQENMVNARGWGTIHSYGDANSIPQIEYHLKNGDSIFRPPTIDFHVVHDMSPVLPPGKFTLRGSSGKRERVQLNLKIPKDTTDAQLSPFVTINNALLVLHLDAANSAHSDVAGDTIGPDVVQLGSVDSADHYDGNGYLDPSDPTNTTYRFQVRGMVEQWLRDTTKNFGFELRSGFVTRSFNLQAAESIGVEDYTLNRWTFFDQTCSDITKRPYFIISYSKLK